MFELFGCHCNPQMAVGLDEGSPAPSGELLGCGPHGGLQLLGTCRGIVWWWGSSGGGEGCAACAQPLPVPSPCLLLAASSAVPLARCCPAFCVSALTDALSKGTLNYGNHSVVHLPGAFPVLQLAGMAGEL